MGLLRIIKSIRFSYLAITILVAGTLVPAHSSTIQLEFDEDTVSANIKDVPLRKVINEIKKETEIWFRLMISENAPVLSEDISVRFKEEPVEEALDRIFRPVNHSLVFDKEDNVIGVFLFGKPGPRPYQPRRPVRRRVPSRVRRR